MDQHVLNEPAPSGPEPPPSSRAVRAPARRSSTDRLIGGVSTAAAQYLGISRTTARIVFVVAGLVGGLGVVVYAVLWLFVPDDQERVLIQGYASTSKESLASALVSGVATLMLSAWVTRDGPSWLASILVTVGVWVLSRRVQPTGESGAAPPAPPGDAGPPPPFVPTSEVPWEAPADASPADASPTGEPTTEAPPAEQPPTADVASTAVLPLDDSRVPRTHGRHRGRARGNTIIRRHHPRNLRSRLRSSAR